MPLTIDFLADQINEAASRFRIGSLRDVRRKLGKNPRANKLFTKSTIKSTYAFNDGGRQGLQFNIGFEDRERQRWWRHGVAFSFEQSRTLPNPEILRPNVHRFNQWVRQNANDLHGFTMWHEEKGGPPSKDRTPTEIDETLIKSGVFVFLGTRVPETAVDVDHILRDFDRLLPLYEFVESHAEQDDVSFVREAEQAAVAAPGWKHAKGQGFLQNTELRVAVEKYAMDAARRHFESEGFACEDQSKNHPYDFRCKRRQEVLFIEVKGTQTDGDEIILTANEVEFARSHKSQMGLFILRSIQVAEVDGKFRLTGGEKRLVLPWDMDPECLKPQSYIYQVPTLSPSVS